MSIRLSICLIITALLMPSCQLGSSTSEEVEPPTSKITLRTSIADMTGSAGLAPNDNFIVDKRAYIFTNDILVSSTLLTSELHSLEIGADAASRIYVVANTAAFADLAKLEVGKSNLSALSNIKSSDATTQNGAPLFMMGYVEVKAGDKTANVDLARGVARIDVKSSFAAVNIVAIRIANVAANSTVVPIGKSTTTAQTMNFAKTFHTPLSLPQLGVLYLYEHNNLQNSTVEVDVIYDNVNMTVKANLPSSINRNTLYEILVEKINGKVDCTLNILDWSNGGSIEAQPDLISRVTIDPLRTITPDTVLVDVQNSEIIVPGWGSNFVVAFNSDVQLEVIAPADAPAVFTKIDGQFNKYNVVVASRAWNTGQYSASFGLRSQLLQNATDKITITVEDRPYIIPTTTLGGVEWMAFNSLGADGLKQTNPSVGQTIQDVYQTRYADAMGLYYHWGLIHSFVPWNNTNHNTSDLKDNPWKTDGKMPCPPHFKVASQADFEKIYPANTPIPSSYSVKGIDYKISYVNPSTQITLPSAAKINPRYVVIEEVVSGAQLFLPLAGSKGDKQSGAGREMGSRLVLWTSQASSTGGHARTFNISNTFVGSYPELQMEAFASVRCIRKGAMHPFDLNR